MLYCAKLILLLSTSGLLKYLILKLPSQQVDLPVAPSNFCCEVILQLSRKMSFTDLRIGLQSPISSLYYKSYILLNKALYYDRFTVFVRQGLDENVFIFKGGL